MLYVDHARIRFRRMLMSHLVADSPDELLQAQTDLGIPDGSIQYPGTWKEHLDVSESKRTLAVRMGAKEITGRELVEITRKKKTDGLPDP